MENKIELEGIFENGYGFISKKIMQDRDLSIASKGIYSYLCSYSGKGNDVFPSRKKICYDLNISNDTLGKYLKELQEKGYIKVSHEKNNGKFLNNVYKICLNLPCPKSSDTEISYTETSDTVNLDTNNNIIHNNNNNNNNMNNIYINNRPSYKKQIGEIIDYMNNIATIEKFKKPITFRYRPTSKAHINIITARIKEGYTVDDFKDVIFTCYKKFVKNDFDGKNGKSSIQYYNPETIFTSSKMEKYINEYDRVLNY